MVEHGDLDALRLIARFLVSPTTKQSYLEYQLRRSNALVLALTDAPVGTNAEVGQWLRQNLPELAWDAEKVRFVKK